MFKCRKCEALQAEIAFLRTQNRELTDRIMALADTRAYAAVNLGAGRVNPKEYYGNDEDEIISHDQFGQRILVKKDPEYQADDAAIEGE